MANTNLIKDKYKIDIVKWRYVWLTITGILLIKFPLNSMLFLCNSEL